jgi:YVTN family beta-propeller protein
MKNDLNACATRLHLAGAWLAAGAGRGCTALVASCKAAVLGTVVVSTASLAGPNAWVTNQASEDRVWVVDTATHAVVDTITVEDIPARVAVTPDGAFVYVTIVVNEDALMKAGPVLRSSVVSSPVFLSSYAKSQATSSFFSNKVAVIDAVENTVVTTITTEQSAPFGVAIAPDGASAYVSHLGSVVSVIDIATNTVAATVPVEGELTDLAVTPDGAFVYVTNTSADSVAVIDALTNSVVASVPVDDAPSGIAITPDGGYAYVANVRSDTVSVISIAANAVVATVPVSGGPASVAVAPDGAFAYVTNQLAGNVSVIETAGNTIIATITVGDTPIDVAIRPDGAFAYVTNIFSDSVSVIDTALNALAETVPVGLLPEGIAIAPAASILQVSVDVRPGNDRNSINPRSNGGIWVAILSGDGFDALEIDAGSVRFGPGEAPVLRSGVRDVDLDGTIDLLLRFDIAEAAIECGDTEVALSGQTRDGLAIAGEDTVRTVGCTPSVANLTGSADRRPGYDLHAPPAGCRSGGRGCSLSSR